MIHLEKRLEPSDLTEPIARMWRVSAGKILSIEKSCPPGDAAPVFTVNGRYTARGWTDWTRGFQYGSAILQFDATGDEQFLHLGRDQTIGHMSDHLTHMGVHDHGFNHISTYGNLRRLLLEGRLDHDQRELQLYELALKVSGAVQAMRWKSTADGQGYIYSFNGPHSLFADTIRSLRSLAISHGLGHRLMGENDEPICLLGRLIQHARTTAAHNVYFGKQRDIHDVRGRVAHESIFNVNDGQYRCPSSQQGHSPFSTWTRGLAWIMLGYSEQLEFLECCDDGQFNPHGGRKRIETTMLETARATSDFYIDQTPADGVPYWDTGAPGLVHLDNYLHIPSQPINDHEPVDASAAAIAAQGLLRLGRTLGRVDPQGADRYIQAGLRVLATLLDDPYLSTDPAHQGLLVHSIYHRPRGWDHVPAGSKIPHSESCMWGDYHLREAALLVQRIAKSDSYPCFFGPRSTP